MLSWPFLFFTRLIGVQQSIWNKIFNFITIRKPYFQNTRQLNFFQILVTKSGTRVSLQIRWAWWKQSLVGQSFSIFKNFEMNLRQYKLFKFDCGTHKTRVLVQDIFSSIFEWSFSYLQLARKVRAVFCSPKFRLDFPCEFSNNWWRVVRSVLTLYSSATRRDVSRKFHHWPYENVLGHSGPSHSSRLPMFSWKRFIKRNFSLSN